MIWDIPTGDKPAVYITFDDGPHPDITRYVLEQLDKYSAKATFFCVGENVSKYPHIYQRVLAAQHSTGNHTYNHINGWKTDNAIYLDNIKKAEQYINSHAFRPPYGRMKLSQLKQLTKTGKDWKVYMWDVLSADFDREITPQRCLENVVNNIKPGSIVVFHDSEKAWDRMNYALPQVLAYCKEKNWEMKPLPA